MTHCLTQTAASWCNEETSLLLSFSHTQTHTHTHTHTNIHSDTCSLLVQANTALLTWSWERKPQTGSQSPKLYFFREVFSGDRLDFLLSFLVPASHAHTPKKFIILLSLPPSSASLGTLKGFWVVSLSAFLTYNVSSGAPHYKHTHTPFSITYTNILAASGAKAKTNTLNLFLKTWPQHIHTHTHTHSALPLLSIPL